MSGDTVTSDRMVVRRWFASQEISYYINRADAPETPTHFPGWHPGWQIPRTFSNKPAPRRAPVASCRHVNARGSKGKEGAARRRKRETHGWLPSRDVPGLKIRRYRAKPFRPAPAIRFDSQVVTRHERWNQLEESWSSCVSRSRLDRVSRHRPSFTGTRS